MKVCGVAKKLERASASVILETNSLDQSPSQIWIACSIELYTECLLEAIAGHVACLPTVKILLVPAPPPFGSTPNYRSR